MSILIKGMEMPGGFAERGFVIRGDGRVRTFAGTVIDYATAVPVPPHGDLIDRDKLRGTMFIGKFRGTMLIGEQCLYSRDEIEDAIDYAPTIIPAEEDEI